MEDVDRRSLGRVTYQNQQPATNNFAISASLAREKSVPRVIGHKQYYLAKSQRPQREKLKNYNIEGKS